MNETKTEQKGKTSFTEKISVHLPSRWFVYSMLTYGDPLDQLEMCCSKDCVQK